MPTFGEGSWLHIHRRVGEGADHLLFLPMLLIPAPLLASGGRWQPAPSGRSVMGPLVTLAHAGAGVIDLPSRPVETLMSIAVSAVHGLRPLIPRGEVFIAGGVGFVWAVSWMLERSAVTRPDPFQDVQTWLVERPFLVAAAVALLALVAARRAPVRPSVGNTRLTDAWTPPARAVRLRDGQYADRLTASQHLGHPRTDD